MFVPELWNVYYRTLEGADRTNNYAESAHRKLQRAFSCSHPTLLKFIDILKREQKARDADIARLLPATIHLRKPENTEMQIREF